MTNLNLTNLPLYASQDQLRAMQAASTGSVGADRLDYLVALAWSLRERDCDSALTMGVEAEALLQQSGMNPADRTLRLARVALTKAHVHALFARFAEAKAAVDHARQMFEAVGDPSGLGDVSIIDAVIAEEQGKTDEVSAALLEAERIYEQGGDLLRQRAARGWREVVSVDLIRQTIDDASGVKESVTPRDEHPSIQALHYAAFGFLWLSEVDSAQTALAFARAHRLATEAGMIRLSIICATRTSLCFQDVGDGISAGEWCDTAYAAARRARWPSMLATCDNHFGRLLYCNGNYEASRDVLTRALATAGPKRAYTLWFLGATLIALKKAEEAIVALAFASTAFAEQGAVLPECGALLDQARALTATGEPQTALDLVEKAQALAAVHRITSHEVLVCETLADIYLIADLPPPTGMTLPNATLHFLERALAASASRPGSLPSSLLLSRLARAWADVGEFEQGVAYYERSLEAVRRETAIRDRDRFVASHVREEIDRVRREFEHQQQLAAAETRRADDLQRALDALQEAQAGLAERTMELERLSLLDPLTGIANRRHFEERAFSEISRLDRYGTPLTVVAFDIDHFKRVNDTYGHAAGDRVLVEIAAIVRRCLRPNDLIARIGGEEFALLLPATDKSGALVIAERVRAELEGMSISFRDIEIRVTASFGAAEHLRGARQLDDALLRADVALYRAKRNGRNRIECDG